MVSNLSISRLINVEVILTQLAAQGQALNSLLLLGQSDVIDVVTRMREYDSLDNVGLDFGTTAAEYLAAELWFAQQPQPTSILIGRWVNTDSKGQLICGAVTPANQAISAWTGIVDGGFDVNVNGTPLALSGMDFSAQTNLNGVASVIQTQLAGLSAGSTVVWDANYERFVFTSGTSGAGSTVGFLAVASTGGTTDISLMLNGRNTAGNGAYVADGIAAETALEAVSNVFDPRFGQQWYGLVIPQAVDADHVAVAGYIEAATNKHFYGVTTQESGVLVSGDTSDIAYQLQQLKYKKTTTQYSSESPYAVVSILARILTTDYNESNSFINTMYKVEPGVVAEDLNSNQMSALEAKNCNVYVNYNNGTAIFENGKCASGDWIDEVIGADALAVFIQTALFNVLYTTPTKIPQTDAGVHILTTAVEQECARFVNNGFLAPGVWDANSFGILKTGDFLPKGYYIYAQPIAQQAVSDRAARKSPPIQVAAKTAGAVNTVKVTVYVNQ